MHTTYGKMKLYVWIPCLLLGLIAFFILYGLAQTAGGLAGRAGALAGIPAFIAAGVAVLGLYGLWNRLQGRIGRVHWSDGLSMKRCLPDTGKGILLGIIYFILVVGTMAIAGCYRITGFEFDLAKQLSALAMFFTVAVCEEVIFRGILFRMIDRQFSTTAAYLVSALFFGVSHIANPGATWWAAIAIAIEAGILLSAAYKYSGRLWMPIGIHWAWNYTQGSILGFAVSGGNAGESLFIPEISGPDIITGGAFGAEASIIAVIFGAAISILLIVARRRRTPKSD